MVTALNRASHPNTRDDGKLQRKANMAEPKDLDARVSGIDEKLDRLSSSVDARFQQVDERFDQLVKLIVEEGKATRRHFDIVAEQMKYERNLAIDQSLATEERLTRLTATNAADHVSFDARLTGLEKRQD